MRMDTWALSFIFVVVGMAAGDPSRDELIRTAIDRNVQWLLRGIRDGSFEGPDVARAVVAISLASEPRLWHDIGFELSDKISSIVLEAESRSGNYSNIPSEELALYVQALYVSCNTRVTSRYIWSSVGYEQRVDRFPALAMLALCNARNQALQFYAFGPPYKSGIFLTDELEYLPMAMECIDSFYCRDGESCKLKDEPVVRSGYSYYPLNLTIADLQEMIEPDEDLKPLTSIAAAMQLLIYRNKLRVADQPWAVDFLLNSQDEDGSWGQSALNSYFVLPVLSNKSFLDITYSHCRGKGRIPR